jgi:hypothetical protein
MLLGGLTSCMFWGAVAGMVIGTGISLSIGLFYSSALGTIGIVVGIAGIIGAVFGHVMEHLIRDEGLSFSERATGTSYHRIAGDVGQKVDLTDHRSLKNLPPLKSITEEEVRKTIRAVRADSVYAMKSKSAQMLAMPYGTPAGKGGERRN